MRSALCLTPIAMLALIACSDPAADKPKAEVGPAAAGSIEPASLDASERGSALSFSSDASRIGFIGSKVTGSHTGGFQRFRGEIVLSADAPLESGKVRVEIDMTSVETDTERLTSHLKTGDFFLVEQHPTATFESTRLEPVLSDVATHNVTGVLTLRGVTKSISFPATIEREGDVVSVKSEFAINRKDFGIAYAGKPDDLIRDDVVIQLDLKTTG